MVHLMYCEVCEKSMQLLTFCRTGTEFRGQYCTGVYYQIFTRVFGFHWTLEKSGDCAENHSDPVVWTKPSIQVQSLRPERFRPVRRIKGFGILEF